MEFGLKGTSRLVADVTGSRHSGLGFTVFWLFYGSIMGLFFSSEYMHAPGGPKTGPLYIFLNIEKATKDICTLFFTHQGQCILSMSVICEFT